MLSGSRRKRGGDEYVFIDGRAMTSEEAVRIELAEQEAAAPGQQEAAAVPGAAEAAAAAASASKRFWESSRKALKDMDEDDALAPRTEPGSLARGEELLREEKRILRRKTLVFGAVLLVLAAFSLCVSAGYYNTIYSPLDVLACYGSFLKLSFTQVFNPAAAADLRYEIVSAYPMYQDVLATFLDVFKYVFCGVILAVSGMLYQNSFRNPIAAPSMLGVSNGVSMGILLMVLIYGSAASTMRGTYYLFVFGGGLLILLLVMLGGKFISGKGQFNVVNMLLIGTIVSQLLGVVSTYVMNNFLTEQEWLFYYTLQSGLAVDTPLTFVVLLVGGLIGLIPVVLLRFKLNLVSFSDAETKVLGVDPNKLRILALACGSVLILTAQATAGQVAMISLVIPFISRAVFGAEFRKQLLGNILLGGVVMLIGGDIVAFFYFAAVPLDVGSVVTICAMPLFVWMLAVCQRSWE